MLDDTKLHNLKLFLFAISKLARTDVIANFRLRDGKKEYCTHRVPAQCITHEMVEDHLSSAQPFAIYTVLGGTTQIAAFDLDDHNGDCPPELMRDTALKLHTALIERGLKVFPFHSGGGKGIHLFAFFDNPQPASVVQDLLKEVLASIGFTAGDGGVTAGQAEIYPKQRHVPEDGLGSAIALPLSRQSVPLDPATMLPIAMDAYRPPAPYDIFSPDLVIDPAAIDAHNVDSPHYDPGPPLPGELEEVVAALKVIPADDYTGWIKIALALKHRFGEGGYEFWLDWSGKSPKFKNEHDCRKRWDGLKPRGTVSLGTVFYMARQSGWNGPSNPVIREMNARFGIFTHGRLSAIILKNGNRRESDETPLLGRQPFKDRLQAERCTITDGNNQRQVLKANYWLNHPDACHYYELDFDPDKPPGHNGRVWNLWRGFAYEPIPGSWALLKAHLLENVCNGDQQQYEWFLNWFAFCIQHPASRPDTTPVLIGSPGSGKSIVARHFSKLWGTHAVTISQGAHLLGRFNSHFVARRLVFADEAGFGRNRKEAGVMKAMITEPTVMLEAKGVDPIPMKNRMAFIIASNNSLVVAADRMERRYMMFKVGDAHRQDRAYFAAIQTEMDNGGYEAMMYELLHRDITRGPDPRVILKSDALFEQIIEAEEDHIRYFHSILDAGWLPMSYISKSPRSTTIKALHEDFRAQHPNARDMNNNALGRYLHKVFPGIKSKPNGRYIRNYGRDNQIEEISTQYDFPPLPVARKQFEREIGQEVPWSNDLSDWLSIKEAGGDKPDEEDDNILI